MEETDAVTVTLELRHWRTIVAHVEGGIYRDVNAILSAVYAQVNGQITEAREREAAAAVAEQIAAAQAEIAAHHQDPDDSAEPHAATQPVAVH